MVPFLFTALAACAYGGAPAPYRPPLPEATAHPNLGSFLYQRDCGWCHGDRGEGTRNGPELRGGQNGPALADFMLRTGRMPLTSPDEQMRRQPTRYTQTEIQALVEHVSRMAEDGRRIPEPHPSRGDLGRGAELYLENCAACHSTTGIGGALVQGRFPGEVERRTGVVAPGLQAATPVEIAEAVRTGPGAMPVFGEGAVSDRDLDAIVRYVRRLQNPSDRGGAAIGRVGPVAEGAVSWIVGLGLLLGLSAWIGTRIVRR